MGYRKGDETVELEARIEKETAKAYLLVPTSMGPDECWIPKSQVVEMSPPDAKGNILFTLTEWIAQKNGII